MSSVRPQPARRWLRVATPLHARRRSVRARCVAAFVAIATLAAGCGGAPAGDATIAVATNFYRVAVELAERFAARGGGTVRLVSGSTGQLAAQIEHGAPYDILLAADRERPARLVAAGLAPASAQFTYASGRLSLWSSNASVYDGTGSAALTGASFRRLAIANPELAPYGAAARQVLQRLDLWNALEGRIVLGENVGQAHAMVATGNAEFGFVATSYLEQSNGGGWRWDVPETLHDPIGQDALLLERAAGNATAIAFLDYLRSDAARQLIRESGYGTPL